MPASTTMTIRVSPEVKEKLDRIATSTRRSKSFLAGEAVAAYVDRELEIVEGIKRGLADAKAGRVVPPWPKLARSLLTRKGSRRKPRADEAGRLVG
jgi:predicted transcriptional regulator